jgi:heavy metal sensor kinase
MNFFRKSIRRRLTIWYGLTLAIILGLYSVSLYVFLKHNLSGELDRKLWEDVESVHESLEDLPETISGFDFSKFQEGSSSEIRDRWILEVWALDFTKLLSVPKNDSVPLGQASNTTCSAERGRPEMLKLSDGLNLRVLCARVELGKTEVYIRVARSAERLVHELSELLWIMFISVPAAILLAMMGGYLLARKALSPVEDMTRRAREISIDKLGDRLPVINPQDELGRLAITFNQTFERIEKSFQQMRQFTADASHELRTPLTAIRTMGEVALQDERSAGEYREVLSSVLEETDELRHLVDSLLTLSRADAGHIKLNRKRESISQLVAEVVEHLEVLADEKSQKISLDLISKVEGYIDRAVFRQALINLVENAIKYSAVGKNIFIKTYSSDKSVSVEVIDEGPGIAPEFFERIFERFYRIDNGRSREVGGTGLGLSIAKWAIEAHDGSITVQSKLGQGSRFLVELPIA